MRMFEHNLRLLDDPENLENLTEKIYDVLLEVDEDDSFTFMDYILGEYIAFIARLRVRLISAGVPEDEANEMSSYPGYVYVGIVDMNYWEETAASYDDNEDDKY